MMDWTRLVRNLLKIIPKKLKGLRAPRAHLRIFDLGSEARLPQVGALEELGVVPPLRPQLPSVCYNYISLYIEVWGL